MNISFIWNNIEIFAGLISFAGMAIYMCYKGKNTDDNSNDLTKIILENIKLQKSIAEQSNKNLLGFKKI